MKRIASIVLGLALFAAPAFAGIPWGTTGAPLEQASATPTCTYTATALACIDKMGADVTSLTLAGMTAGDYYTMIWMQDGTGSRALTQTAITGAPALASDESAANGYAVWVIKATSASKASFVADYDNAPLFDVWTGATTTAGTAIAAGAMQAGTAVVIPGIASTNSCSCGTSTYPASWQTGILPVCVPITNAASCNLVNVGPANATVTPTAISLQIRIRQ